LIQQALINLVLNAMAALDDRGGRIRLGYRSAPGKYIFTVEDTGRGIPGDKLELVTRSFFTTRPDGAGSGLSIARRIVETHKGQLTIRSRPGSGTTVEINLPAATGEGV